MMTFLIYEAKVAIALAIFYMFYRLLLRKETFHRLNRVVLVGTALLSFLLPLCIITIHKPVEMAAPLAAEPVAMDLPALETLPLTEASLPWWPVALAVLFWAGVAFVLLRVVLSILCIARIIRRGRLVREEDGCQFLVTERDIDPFSWMKYIVLSQKDWDAPHESILTHEKAHIGYGHSVELLLVDILAAFQWFNPAIWMLRADLQELHEYEADDAVLRSGANIRDYQYLLIRKAVGKSGYSVANSFNHSILKNRITMMSKSRSPLMRGLRVLYLLPLVCLGIGLQARTVYVPVDKDSEKNAPEEKKNVVPEGPAPITLRIRPDGTIECDGKVYTKDQVKDIIPAHQAGDPLTTVQIVAADNVPMGVIDDVKMELRKLEALKLHYFVEPSQDGVTRHTPPMPPGGTAKVQFPVTGPERENLFIIRINSADKIFFGNKPSQDDEEMLQMARDFLKKHGKDTRFSLMADRGASFGVFVHMEELLMQVYSDVRNEKALEQYGKPLADLTPEERGQINFQVPIGIAEAEPRGSR
jgi:biopolymer transport protein ExbD